MRILLIIFIFTSLFFLSINLLFNTYKLIDKREIEQISALIQFNEKYQSTLKQIQAIGANDSLAILIYDKSIKYNFDPILVTKLIKVESNFDPFAISYKGAIGLTQTMSSTCRLYNLECTFEPEINIDNGLYILADKLRQYGTIEKALLSYNGGHKAVKQRFNQAYADNIMKGD